MHLELERLFALHALQHLRRRHLPEPRLLRHAGLYLRALRRRLLLGARRHRLPHMPHVAGVQHEQRAHGPDELRLQLAGLHVERHGAGLRGRARVRGRQHVVGHGLRAVLYLHGPVSVRGRQLHRLRVLANREPSLHGLRSWHLRT